MLRAKAPNKGAAVRRLTVAAVRAQRPRVNGVRCVGGEGGAANVDNRDLGATARVVASLERQVLEAPVEGIILRYGKLHGPGTSFSEPPRGGAVDFDAAADAARRAVIEGKEGIYNIADEDGSVSTAEAAIALDWSPKFRVDVDGL